MIQYKVVQGHRGALFVEFAISVAVFIGLVLSIVDLARVSYQAVGMQFALQRAARFAVVQGETPGDHFQVARNYLIQEGQRFGLDLNNARFEMCPSELASTSGLCPNGSSQGSMIHNTDAGDSESFVFVHLSQPVQLFFPNRVVDVRASVVVKNEPL